MSFFTRVFKITQSFSKHNNIEPFKYKIPNPWIKISSNKANINRLPNPNNLLPKINFTKTTTSGRKLTRKYPTHTWKLPILWALTTLETLTKSLISVQPHILKSMTKSPARFASKKNASNKSSDKRLYIYFKS